jgi:hypothetical protein
VDKKTFYLFKQTVKNVLFLHSWKISFHYQKLRSYTAEFPPYWPVFFV